MALTEKQRKAVFVAAYVRAKQGKPTFGTKTSGSHANPLRPAEPDGLEPLPDGLCADPIAAPLTPVASSGLRTVSLRACQAPESPWP